MFQTNILEEIKHTDVVFHNVYLISCRLWDNLEKYCRANRRR